MDKIAQTRRNLENLPTFLPLYTHIIEKIKGTAQVKNPATSKFFFVTYDSLYQKSKRPPTHPFVIASQATAQAWQSSRVYSFFVIPAQAGMTVLYSPPLEGCPQDGVVREYVIVFCNLKFSYHLPAAPYSSTGGELTPTLLCHCEGVQRPWQSSRVYSVKPKQLFCKKKSSYRRRPVSIAL